MSYLKSELEFKNVRKKLMKVAQKNINRLTGIELTWSEQIALSNYIESCISKAKQGWPIKALDEGIFRFLKDYFELDVDDLGRKPVYTWDCGATTWKDYGLDLIGTEPFKQYCRGHVQQWRDERNLI